MYETEFPFYLSEGYLNRITLLEIDFSGVGIIYNYSKSLACLDYNFNLDNSL
jgi:hypothetical protein